MKNVCRLVCLMLVLCLLTFVSFAENVENEWDYEGGIESIALEIELKSNPTTGYHWFFTCDEPEVLTVVEHGFVSDHAELLGAPGYETFRLDGIEEGFAVVTFSYARTLEEEPLYKLTYHVIVEPDMDVVVFQTGFEM